MTKNRLFKILLFIVLIVVIIYKTTIIKYVQCKYWHFTNGNVIEFNNVKINVPNDWWVYEKSENRITFIKSNKGSLIIFLIDKYSASKIENLITRIKEDRPIKMIKNSGIIDMKIGKYDAYYVDYKDKVVDEGIGLFNIMIPDLGLKIGSSDLTKIQHKMILSTIKEKFIFKK